MLMFGKALDKQQSKPYPPQAIGDPARFDEYSDISWRDERARLDNVALALQRVPGAIIYLSVYGGRRGCAGEASRRAIRAKAYLVNRRRIQERRVLWKDDGHREKPTVDVWILPSWGVKPDPAPTVNQSEVQIKNCKCSRAGSK